MDNQQDQEFFNYTWFDQALGALAQDPSNDADDSEERGASQLPTPSEAISNADPFPGCYPQLSLSSGRESLPLTALPGMAIERTSVTPAVTTIRSTPPNESVNNSGPSRVMERSVSETTDQRKMRNRAAQRAFRERKERHIQELSQTVNRLERNTLELRLENEQLQRELVKMISENQALRKGHIPTGLTGQKASTTVTFTSVKFFNSAIPGDHEKQPSYRLTRDKITGERLLDVGATWELIQRHEYFKMGCLDLVNLCEQLRKSVQCDGYGPVFGEKSIFDAIESSVITDGLI